MKKLKCDLCDHVAQGENFEAWMNAMKPHYGQAHADVMQANMAIPDDQKQAEMMKWMNANKARFESSAL